MDRRVFCVKDIEEHAQPLLQKGFREYYSSGADGQQTLSDNIESYNRYRLRPRVLRDVSKPIDTRVKLLGDWVESPIGVCPTALHKLAHSEGEAATAKGTCLIVSTWTSVPLSDVAKANGPNGVRWFYLDYFSDEELHQSLIEQVELLGFSAIVLTVDNIIPGNRLADLRNHLRLPSDVSLEIFSDKRFVPKNMRLSHEWINQIRKSSVTWDDIDNLKKKTKLPIVLKGILTAEDAQIAVEHGIQAMIVSNHGGRQLDGAPATIDALKEVVQAVDGRAEVYLDGGVRKGTDVLKALAMGAKAVFIGRPVLWGLAYDGHKGVEKVLEILKDELVLAMKLSGCPSLSEIPPELVVHESYYTMPRPKL